jgi:transglutaminase-like putative cysteine protease
MPTKAIKQQLQERYTKWAIFMLIAIGILSITGRLFFSDSSTLPEGDAVWTIAIDARITGAEKGDNFNISPPWNSSQSRVVSQKIQHTGMRPVRIKGDGAQKRSIVLQVTHPGDLSFSAEFNIHISKIPQVDFSSITRPLDAERRELYLSSEEAIDLSSADVTNVLREISADATSKDEIIRKIFAYTNNKIIKNPDATDDTAESVLRSHQATTLGRARTMVALCRAAGVPARIVSGFILVATHEALPHYWVDVYTDEQWVPYAPEKGYAEKLPGNFVAFNRGKHSIVGGKNIEKLNITYDIEQNYDLAAFDITTEKNFSDILNLNRFPPDTRSNLGLLLLLPLGALITAFSRNFIGIRSYGTFTPTLLALAAVYADWIAALVLLIIVVAMGISGRSAMPDKLTRVPRLAIMFTIVIMSMVLGVSLMEYFHINPGEHVILLPIVILTTLIDRFYSTVDDDGAYIAIKRLIWTILISFLCYPVLKLEMLSSLFLTYPEGHFITLSAILIISIYKGKQLSDFSIFYWIREPEKQKKPKPTTDSEII